MRKKLRWLLLIPVVLLVVYFLGPHPAQPDYNMDLPKVPAAAGPLVQYVAANEAMHKLKPDNEARIVWYNDSLKNRTDYAIVYLHGFTASQGEGDPVHRATARKFGCNLYLSRLAEHGIDTTEQLINLTADKYWESAKQALAIGEQLGKKVILVATSTGGTLALKLAGDYPDKIAALVLLSPNIAINNPNAWILNKPWGLQIARMVNGSDYLDKDATVPAPLKQYWSYGSRLEAVVATQELVQTTMHETTFKKVKQPTLLLYYYKDEIQQDSTVRVDAMKKMFAELGTPDAQKKAIAIPNAGTHVIGSSLRSKDVAGVQKAIDDFLKDVMGMEERSTR